MSTDLQRRSRPREGFTLAEVLAALLFMAILIPVTMEGVTVASRAGMIAQRKAAAMRIAERVLDEHLATDQIATSSGSGVIQEGSVSYPWTLRTDPWTEDTMTMVTARVEYTVQGNVYEAVATTLYDPLAATPPTPAQ